MRYELEDKESSIRIAYGIDQAVGLFLQVGDRRLAYSSGASKEVNDVVRSMGAGPTGDSSDGGYYLNLYTGPNGLGLKVDLDSMATYMQRYGIPQEHLSHFFHQETQDVLKKTCDKNYANVAKFLSRLSAGERPSNYTVQMLPKEINEGPLEKMKESNAKKENKESATNVKSDDSCFLNEKMEGKDTKAKSSTETEAAGPCVNCAKWAKLRCKNCSKENGQQVFYCTKECQKEDWSRHKHFCSLAVPAKKIQDKGFSKSSVYGILLPEDGDRPKLVEVPVSEKDRIADVESVIGDEVVGRVFMNVNPMKMACPKLDDYLVFEFRDNFLNDGSEPNKCIRKIIGGKEPHHPWAGPVVALKQQGYSLDAPYIDISLSDGRDIVDYFKSYGSK